MILVQQDLQVTQVIQVQQDLLVLLERLDLQVLQVLQEKQVKLDLLVTLVKLDLQELQEILV